MRHLLLLLLLIACPSPSWAVLGGCQIAVSNCIQWRKGSLAYNTVDGNGLTLTAQVIQLETASLAGNLIPVFCTFADTQTISSVVDDQSQTYTAVTAEHDTNNGQYAQWYYLQNTAAGVHAITVTWTGANTFTMCSGGEFYHMAITSVLDKNAGNFSATNSTAPTAGSLGTLGQSGDVILAGWFRDGTIAATSYTIFTQTNITWHFLGVDRQDGMAVQGGIYSSTTALNPEATWAPTTQYVGATVAFKVDATKGTAPSSTQIRPTEVMSLDFPISTSVANPAYSTAQTVQFACSGTSIDALIVTGGNHVTSITADSNSNTWVCSATQPSNSSLIEHCYVSSATCSDTESFTLNWTNNTTDASVWLTSLVNSGSFDKIGAGTTGTEVSGGNQTGDPISPTNTTDEWVISGMGVDYNKVMGCTGTGQLSSLVYGVGNPTGPDPLEEANGYMGTLTTSTSSFTPTWTQQFTSGTGCDCPTTSGNCLGGNSCGFGKWAALSIAFKETAAATAQTMPPVVF